MPKDTLDYGRQEVKHMENENLDNGIDQNENDQNENDQKELDELNENDQKELNGLNGLEALESFFKAGPDQDWGAELVETLPSSYEAEIEVLSYLLQARKNLESISDKRFLERIRVCSTSWIDAPAARKLTDMADKESALAQQRQGIWLLAQTKATYDLAKQAAQIAGIDFAQLMTEYQQGKTATAKTPRANSANASSTRSPYLVKYGDANRRVALNKTEFARLPNISFSEVTWEEVKRGVQSLQIVGSKFEYAVGGKLLTVEKVA